MPEPEISNESSELLSQLRAHADDLERRLADLQKETESRIIRAELKTEAVRAGIIDLDGLKLLDVTSLRLDENAEVDGAAQLIVQLKRSKPWLFGGNSTSSTARAPMVQPPGQKRATEMTEEEYRAARTALIHRQP